MNQATFFQVLGIMNLVTLAVYLVDYVGALKRGFRFPDVVLWILAGIFGSFGAYIAMLTSGHKLYKPEYKFGVPLLVVMHLMAIMVLVVLWSR